VHDSQRGRPKRLTRIPPMPFAFNETTVTPQIADSSRRARTSLRLMAWQKRSFQVEPLRHGTCEARIDSQMGSEAENRDREPGTRSYS